ncbi:MAG: recombination protein RecR [Bacteroidetes bacterium]|nr:MAG: recombination protein RecR [Bacteroidota bacterium]
MNFPSRLVEDAVNEFAKLPGVGRKTALRFVLHLLRKDPAEVEKFGSTFIRLRQELKHCHTCHNISESEICDICSNPRRDPATVCIVEDVRDVMAIENTNQYTGVYHVLGGIISPMDGIGPGDLSIDHLVQRASSGTIREMIMALSTTMEGDTTNFYIYKRLKEFNISVSTIARGIAIGDELEYADEVTLGRSIVNRVPYEKTIAAK